MLKKMLRMNTVIKPQLIRQKKATNHIKPQYCNSIVITTIEFLFE
jgi:hypothetical protein